MMIGFYISFDVTFQSKIASKFYKLKSKSNKDNKVSRHVCTLFKTSHFVCGERSQS